MKKLDWTNLFCTEDIGLGVVVAGLFVGDDD